MKTIKQRLKIFCKHCNKETSSSNRKTVKLGRYPKFFYVCLECGNPYEYWNYQELVEYLNRKSKKGRKTVRTSISLKNKQSKEKILRFRKAGFYKNSYKLYLQTNHWKELRLKKLKKNPVCQVCRKEKANQVHHLSYNNANGETILYKEKLSDLLSVCRKCHKDIHKIS